MHKANGKLSQTRLVGLMLTLITVGATAYSTSTDVKGLNFGQKKLLGLRTPYWIGHIKLDLYRGNGSLLFTSVKSLYTADADGKRATVVVSGFKYAPSFVQITPTQVVITDHNSHCIKVLDRITNSLRVLAGKCDQHGRADGTPGLFNGPRSVKIDIRNPNQLLVTDRYNQALRSVDIKTGYVRTVISYGFRYPRVMAWYNDRLLITNDDYISETTWSATNHAANTILAGSHASGDIDGAFEVARFNNAIEIQSLYYGLYLDTDRRNNKLRFLNMKTRQVLPVCINSNSNSCTVGSFINAPNSILQVGDTVYIGSYGKIYKLSNLSFVY